MIASTRCHLRLRCLLFSATIFGFPSCARGSICGYLNFGILNYYVDHGYPTHGIFDYSYSPSRSVYLDIGTMGYHLLEQPGGFPLQPQYLRRTDHCDCRGMSAHRLLSSLTFCDAPAVIAGDIRVY